MVIDSIGGDHTKVHQEIVKGLGVARSGLSKMGEGPFIPGQACGHWGIRPQ